MVTQKQFFWSDNFKKSLLLQRISWVVDFALFEGSQSWSFREYYSVFRQILPPKTVIAFCSTSFTSQYKFS